MTEQKNFEAKSLLVTINLSLSEFDKQKTNIETLLTQSKSNPYNFSIAHCFPKGITPVQNQGTSMNICAICQLRIVR